MRALVLIPFAATVANAKPPSDKFVASLAAWLAHLADLPQVDGAVVNPLDLSAQKRAALRASVAKERTRQDGIMRAFAGAVSIRYQRHLLSWDFMYTLTSALAGRTLSIEGLEAVVRPILDMMDMADCPNCEWQEENPQAIAAQMFDSLTKLGVSPLDAATVTLNLAQSARMISLDEQQMRVIPIPPARPDAHSIIQ
jgi:hypothetical protein